MMSQKERMGATFSADRTHRYVLHRRWNQKKEMCCFICLNPSTADEYSNDPTVTRCIKYAEKWGYGGMFMLNMFAFRSTDRSVLKVVQDPIGRDNDFWIKKIAAESKIVVVGWGNDGMLYDRHLQVLSLLEFPYCLTINKNGTPGHPLYLKGDLTPTPYIPNLGAANG